MSLSSICIRRPVLAIVLNLAILLFGFIGYRSLGTNEFPIVDPPVVTVNTRYTGANAEIIESQITEPLEKAINGIEGIRNISSSSNLGSSSITVEFDLNSNLEGATNDVRDKVSEAVRSLPQDIDAPPVVQKSDAANTILVVCLKSEQHNIMQLNEFAENSVIPRIQTIPGVSSVRNFSTKKYSMRLRLDPSKMAALKITANDVKNALDRENVELPSGKIYGESNELIIKTAGRLFTENDFNQLILSAENGRVIRFQDIGLAELGPENEENQFRVNGVFMTGFGVNPQPGANYIAIADEFYRRVEQLKGEMPPGFDIFVAMDNTQFVRRSIAEVKETIFIAVILVVLVIYFFFRDWVVAFRPLIDIPVSLVGAFFIMFLAGFTINVLTLLAIVLATGLVVDDGIVVTENIYKKIEAGMPPVEAAIKGSNEILFAVLSTSTTLAVVFLPLLFLEGFVGKLFIEFGVTIAGAVLISAFVSLSLTPMLNAYLVRKHAKPSWFYRVTEPFFEKMESGYSDSLGRFLGRRWLALPIIAGVTWMIFHFGGQLPNELAPLEDRNQFRMSVTTPESSSFDFTDFVMQKVGKFAQDSIPEANVVMVITVPGFTGSGASNTGFVRVNLGNDPEAPRRSQQEIVDMVGKNLRKFSEARIFPIQEQTISVGGSSRFGLPVQYVLKAPSFEKLKEKLPLFLEEAKKSPVFQGVDANLKFNLPELNLTIDRDKARALGVNVAEVAQTIQLSLGGIRYGYFTIAGKQYQIIGQLDRNDRNQPADISKLYVKNAQGEMIRLDNLLTMREASSPPQLYHFNRYMAATVSASLAPGYTIGDGLVVMDSVAKKILDPTFSTDVSGPSRDFKESSSNIQFTFILALVLIFLVLAAQFESFIDPFIILFTVPLAIGGAVFSLWFFNLTLNIFSQIGILMLIGLVTKNGILIVEFANQLREKGMEKQAAIQEAARMRLRPILMTTIATALGAMPIALGLGAGSASRIPMGTVIVCGLMFALVLTLYVIPAMYSFLSGKKKVLMEESPALD